MICKIAWIWTIYDNLWQSWTSKAPSGKPILAVRESIKSSLVSPPMPLTRYSARSTMPSSSSSWTKPCLAQLGNRSAEQVAPLSIASCQIPGHQWFVICSMRTLAHLKRILAHLMHILDHLSTLRAHRNLLRLSLPHLYRFLSHSFPFYVLHRSTCICLYFPQCAPPLKSILRTFNTFSKLFPISSHFDDFDAWPHSWLLCPAHPPRCSRRGYPSSQPCWGRPSFRRNNWWTFQGDLPCSPSTCKVSSTRPQPHPMNSHHSSTSDGSLKTYLIYHVYIYII